MRMYKFALALCAAVSMSLLPGLAPLAQAAANDPYNVIDGLAKKKKAAVLTLGQMEKLKKSHPALHSKLLIASRTGQPPALSTSERKLVDSLTRQALRTIRAGQPAPAQGSTPVLVSKNYPAEFRACVEKATGGQAGWAHLGASVLCFFSAVLIPLVVDVAVAAVDMFVRIIQDWFERIFGRR